MITRDRQEEQLKVGSGVDRQKQQRVQTNTAVQEVQALRPTAAPVNRYVAPVVSQPEKGFVNELLSGLSSLAPAVNKLYMAREEKLYNEAVKEAESKVQGMTFEEAQAAVKSGELDQAANPYYQAAFNKTYGARAGIELKRKMAIAYENEFDKDSGNVDEFVSSFMAAQKQELGDNEFALQGFELATKDVRDKFIGAQTDYDTQKKKTETNDSVFTVVSETIAQLKSAGASSDVISSELMKLGSGYKNTLGFEYADFDKIVLASMSGYAEAGDVDFVNSVLDDKRGGLGPLSNKTSLLGDVNKLKSTAVDQNVKRTYNAGMDLRFTLENQADTGRLDYDLMKDSLERGLIKEADYVKFDSQNDSALKALRKDNDKQKYKLEADLAYNDLLSRNMELFASGNTAAMTDQVIPDGLGGTKLITVSQQKSDVTSNVMSVFNRPLQLSQDGTAPVNGTMARIVKATTGETLEIGSRIPVADVAKLKANASMYLGIEDSQTRGLFDTVYNRFNEGSFSENLTNDFVTLMSTLNHVYTEKGISGVSDYLGSSEKASIFEHANDLIGQGVNQTDAFREAASFSRFYESSTPSQKERANRVNSAIAVSLTGDDELSEIVRNRFGEFNGVSAEVMQYIQRKSKITSIKATEGADEAAIARNAILSLDATDLSVVDGYLQLMPSQLNINGRVAESSQVFSEFKDNTLDQIKGISGDPDIIVTLGNTDREPSLIGDSWDSTVDWFTDRDPTKGLNREFVSTDNLVWQRINGASGGRDVWRLVTSTGSSLPVTIVNKKTGVRKQVEFTTDQIKKGWGSLNEDLTKARDSMAMSSIQGTQELRNFERDKYPVVGRRTVNAINDLEQGYTGTIDKINEYHPMTLLLESTRTGYNKVSKIHNEMNAVSPEERKQKESEMMDKLNKLKANTGGSPFPPIDSLTQESANEVGLSMRASLDNSGMPDRAELERLVLNNQ